MAEIDLDAARARLLEERERIERLIAAREGDVEESGASDDEAAPEEYERGDLSRSIVEGEQQQALLADLRANLEEIDAALERIENGTYGIDEETGEPIAPERLEAFPTARTNVR